MIPWERTAAVNITWISVLLKAKFSNNIAFPSAFSENKRVLLLFYQFISYGQTRVYMGQTVNYLTIYDQQVKQRRAPVVIGDRKHRSTLREGTQMVRGSDDEKIWRLSQPLRIPKEYRGSFESRALACPIYNLYKVLTEVPIQSFVWRRQPNVYQHPLFYRKHILWIGEAASTVRKRKGVINNKGAKAPLLLGGQQIVLALMSAG